MFSWVIVVGVRPLRAFISVDMEGMPYVVLPEELSHKRTPALYGEARKVMTRVTKVVAETLHEMGFSEVVVADSHGYMVNLIADELPEYVTIVRGFPRPISMMCGVQGCNVALFLGYHARAGVARATFDHTYSGAHIYSVRINGVEVSEYLLNTYVAGYYGVPVILVAGDERLVNDEVRRYTPWSERIVLKRGLTRWSAQSPAMSRIEQMLREGVKRAVERWRRRLMRVLRPPAPVNLEVVFTSTLYADIAELLPGVQRINGRTVTYRAPNILDAYRVLELMVLACAATRAMSGDL